MRLYPIDVMPWKLRKHSIYGLSVVEGLAANQKAINYIMAMMILSVQDTAWPKVISRPGASPAAYQHPGELIIDTRLLGRHPLPGSGAPFRHGVIAFQTASTS
jgi:hypothetical protein